MQLLPQGSIDARSSQKQLRKLWCPDSEIANKTDKSAATTYR
jgi:hypothetical protein